MQDGRRWRPVWRLPGLSLLSDVPADPAGVGHVHAAVTPSGSNTLVSPLRCRPGGGHAGGGNYGCAAVPRVAVLDTELRHCNC